jgi:hypothetical protein
VIVGWNDTSTQVSSVTDASLNSYQLAVGPTQQSAGVSQAIYYAKNINAAAAGNKVTVTFNSQAQFPDIRILEYYGIDPVNAVDVTAASSGSSSSSATSAVPITNPMDLLVGANITRSYTTGPGPNLTVRLLTPDDDIAEDRVVTTSGSYNVSAPLGKADGWVMQLVAFRAGPADVTPPTVSVTSPQSGSTLTGTINVAVTASDTGSGLAGVQFQVNGATVGTGSAASPATFSLNTANFPDGPYTITGTAFDFANNVGISGPISVTFSNSRSGNLAQTGMWSGTTPLPLVSVHSALLPNSRILMVDGQTAGSNSYVWDSRTNTSDFAQVPLNIFCNALEEMADGGILEVGGHVAAHVGVTNATIFDPGTETWTPVANMAFPRWYPTLTMLPSGNLIVTSGETNCDECDEKIQEIYNPSANSWSQLSTAPFFFPYYPHVFVLPDGRVIVPADGQAPIVSEVLDLNALTWTSVGGSAVDGGSTAMYLPGKFLKVGRSVDPDAATVSSVNTAYVLDMTQSSPVWLQVAPMAFPRTYHNTTILPDGTVLVTGGGTTTGATDVAHAVYPAELWSPNSGTWTTLAAMNAPRLYHSEALLLPDGRVLVHGGGRFNGINESTDQLSAEFFAPPYLFKGPRPTIAAAPSQLQYGQPFTVQTPDAGRIAAVSLIRFGTATHAINMGQRFIPLSFQVGAGSLTISAPVNANLAPPGNYMLFILDTNGVPSVAATVHF